MSEFKPGDVVAVLYDHRLRSQAKVRRVTRRFVELSDDSKWQPDGLDTYPRDHDSWHSRRIVPWSSEYDETVKRSKLMKRLDSFSRDWRNNLPTDQLQQLVDLLDSFEAHD